MGRLVSAWRFLVLLADRADHFAGAAALAADRLVPVEEVPAGTPPDHVERAGRYVEALLG